MRGPWTLEVFGLDGRVFSSNDDHRAGRWKVSARRKEARLEVRWKAREARIPKLTRARVEPTIHLRNWRRADPANYPGGATLKGALDGLVDAGVVPDDRQEFLDVQMPRLVGLDGGVPRVVLVIHELDAGEMTA